MKILLVDDHSLFREGLRHLLSELAADATILEAGSGSKTRITPSRIDSTPPIKAPARVMMTP